MCMNGGWYYNFSGGGDFFFVVFFLFSCLFLERSGRGLWLCMHVLVGFDLFW